MIRFKTDGHVVTDMVDGGSMGIFSTISYLNDRMEQIAELEQLNLLEIDVNDKFLDGQCQVQKELRKTIATLREALDNIEETCRRYADQDFIEEIARTALDKAFGEK